MPNSSVDGMRLGWALVEEAERGEGEWLREVIGASDEADMFGRVKTRDGC